MRYGPLLQVGLFLTFLYAGLGVMLAFGGSDAVSDTENRALAPLPLWSIGKLRSGEYFRDLENYWADHVAFRGALVSAGKRLTSWYGVAGKDDVILIASDANNTGSGAIAAQTDETVSPAATGPTAESGTAPASMGAGATPPPVGTPAPAPVPAPAPTPVSGEKERIVGKVLIVGDRAMNLFAHDPNAGTAYADVVNRFADEAARRLGPDTSVTVLLAPTAAEWAQASAKRPLSDSQRQAIEDIYNRLRPRVRTVDAWTALRDHGGQELYFRTDHHWTATGAYYAYAAFAGAAGMTPVALERYETESVPGFLGSLYSATLSPRLRQNPDSVKLYKPFVSHEYTVHYSGPLRMNVLDMSHASKTNKYRIFLSGDRPWGLIKTDSAHDRRIAVVKDSYGNAFVPFLLPHYKEIYVIDPRQFHIPLTDFLAERRIAEVLFLNDAEVSMYRGFTDQIDKLLRK
ncbi:DHHW family protein [Paenibacillus flagellatus]|uniref:AlgX/AlgJ SGNH hydrolase-like domain-containing protein n=1 Tax=Paenibacillus flagellatus TaxID=2211139 RepID=A0A2V5KRW8_9BACL|nr:DHHW family protein [Paenibacillus flagellatus]PYI54227.1 hypothetical protein DLM86_12105 [Paenibacillus flagellatus]